MNRLISLTVVISLLYMYIMHYVVTLNIYDLWNKPKNNKHMVIQSKTNLQIQIDVFIYFSENAFICFIPTNEVWRVLEMLTLDDI